jgi:hypothetical protein
MSLSRVFIVLTVLLFAGIGVLAIFKGKGSDNSVENADIGITFEVQSEPVLIAENRVEAVTPEVVNPKSAPQEHHAKTHEIPPNVDRIDEFFNRGDNKFPIVQTITYKSKVAWMKGRPAWLSDYASHYKTSRHFIARSLNNRPDYFKQEVAEGDKFNVLREDKHFEFYLVVDIVSCKMMFYFYDNDTHQLTLVKTYDVGVGRVDESAESGYRTPLGKYTLGDKIAVYRPKTISYHQGEKVEMVRVFGTRWIPFGDEVEGCTASPKGFGLHGLPWIPNTKGELVEDLSSIGGYQSDGCIRLATVDIEEIFSIIISRPTTIEIVKGIENAKLPGEKKKL